MGYVTVSLALDLGEPVNGSTDRPHLWLVRITLLQLQFQRRWHVKLSIGSD
jgi:hypothetical protein